LLTYDFKRGVESSERCCLCVRSVLNEMIFHSRIQFKISWLQLAEINEKWVLDSAKIIKEINIVRKENTGIYIHTS